MADAIKIAEFITSAADIERYLSVYGEINLPEICMAGRSNAGKSSLINMLAGRKIAKVSQTPGRTRLINFFEFTLLSDLKFMLVDLPGYGFAKAPKTEIDKWQRLMNAYFMTPNAPLRHTFILVDSRIAPTVLDKQMVNFLYSRGLPFTILATKTDKLSKAQIGRNIQNIAKEFALGVDNIMAVSSVTGVGKDKLIEKLRSLSEDVGNP